MFSILCAELCEVKQGRSRGGLDSAYCGLPITFGNNGYIARYRYADDTVTIFRIHHQREADR